jgi:large subunit ribosomal protein L29
MKTKEKKQIKEKNVDELKAALKEAKEILFTLKLEKAQNKLKNTRSIFMKRKEVARILTEMKRKEIENAKNA